MHDRSIDGSAVGRLDGRNRYRACAHIGVEPIFTQYEGNDPTSYVISLNLRRRHLNESQRAMVAAKLANITNGGDRRSDQSANLQSGLANDNTAAVSRTTAAGMLNVAERSVARAADVQRNAIPDLAQAVDRGEVSVSAAATVARLEHDAQSGIVEHWAAAVRDAECGRNVYQLARLGEGAIFDRHETHCRLHVVSEYHTGRHCDRGAFSSSLAANMRI